MVWSKPTKETQGGRCLPGPEALGAPVHLGGLARPEVLETPGGLAHLEGLADPEGPVLLEDPAFPEGLEALRDRRRPEGHALPEDLPDLEDPAHPGDPEDLWVLPVPGRPEVPGALLHQEFQQAPVDPLALGVLGDPVGKIRRGYDKERAAGNRIHSRVHENRTLCNRLNQTDDIVS